MGFILKVAAGLYILSVLAFSSWSRAAEVFYPHNLQEISKSSIKTVSTNGVVFEEGGYLYFQTSDNSVCLIHSNSFNFFKNTTLPKEVYINGQSINNRADRSEINAIIQITSVNFLDN